MPTPSAEPCPSLPSLLAARAASEPSDPWLFQRELWDWRWRSWARVAEHVAGAAALLEGLPEDARVGFDARPSSDAVTLDLAIQAAGRVAVPVRGESVEAACAAAERLGCRVWLGVGPQPLVPNDRLTVLAAPAVRSRLEAWGKKIVEPLPAGRGPVIVEGGRKMTQETLLTAARRLDARVGPARGRHVAAASFALDVADGRVFTAWALLAGAALLLEPFPDAVLAGLLWTRPTVVHGSAELLAGIARAYAERRLRRTSRLRTFLLSGEEEPDADAMVVLERAGAVVTRLFLPGVENDRGCF